VRGPRPRGRTAHGHAGARPTATRTWPALAGPASAGATRAEALPGGARLGGGSAPAHGRRRERWLTGAETAAQRRRATARRPAAVRATRLQTAAVRARAVGTAAARGRRRSGGAGEAVGTRREGRGGGRRAARSAGLGGAECGRCPDSALNHAVAVVATLQRRAAARAQRSARRLTSGPACQRFLN
jgi:hypothetical protein